MPWHFISGLFQQATAQGSRSTVLRPLGWLLAISGTLVIGCIEVKADVWIDDIFVVICALAGALYLGAYLFCLVVEPRCLAQ
jgi:cyanate permease